MKPTKRANLHRESSEFSKQEPNQQQADHQFLDWKKQSQLTNMTAIMTTTRKLQLIKMRKHSTHTVALVLAIILVTLLASIMPIECHYKRTQYHEQGLHGPKSYKFGYTSGDHKSPQERHEVSDGYGHVKGWYSYVDAYGKHQVVHYEAHPKYGFKVYNYKSKAYNNGKRHYGS